MEVFWVSALLFEKENVLFFRKTLSLSSLSLSVYWLFTSADDMGLGKTLTMISLILAKKNKEREEDEKKEDKKLEKWISKNGYENLFSLFQFIC